MAFCPPGSGPLGLAPFGDLDPYQVLRLAGCRYWVIAGSLGVPVAAVYSGAEKALIIQRTVREHGAGA